MRITFEITDSPDEQGDHVGFVVEMPGLSVFGLTQESTLAELLTVVGASSFALVPILRSREAEASGPSDLQRRVAELEQKK